MTLDHIVNLRLTVGLETNPGNYEVLPRATWFASPAKGHIPGISLGWTSDRLSTPKGQAVFLTFNWPTLIPGITPFVSGKWDTGKDRLYFPFGANAALGKAMTLQAVYDGNYTHLLLTHRIATGGISLMLAKSRYFGIHTSIGF